MPTATLIRIQAELVWQCFPARGGHWVGVCDPLKLTVQAHTWTELMEDIGHTLDAMLKDLLRTNELDKFLRDHGWTPVGRIPVHPTKEIKFDVPFLPALMGTHGSQRDIHQ